jgi:hypothetical protein
MTFGILGLFTLATGISWKERTKIIAHNQRLQAELTRLAPAAYLAAIDESEQR